MQQATCNYKKIIVTPNTHYVEKQRKSQSTCWNVKKRTSSHFRKNKKKIEVTVLKAQDQDKVRTK